VKFSKTFNLVSMGVRREGQNGHLPPWKLGLRSKNLWKTWNQQFNSDSLGYFLQWQFVCRYDTHTAQESGSLFAKLRSELFYYWPLLRNNNMVTNFQRCNSSHGGKRFVCCM